MAEAVDGWLDDLDGLAMRDRRNGHYTRWLMTELGDIELRVPRTRHFCPTEVQKSYARCGAAGPRAQVTSPKMPFSRGALLPSPA